MRLIFVLFTMAMSYATLGFAQSPPRAPNFSAAETQFNTLSPAQRVQFQIMLAAEGSWPAIPNLTFSARLQNAIADFQRANGYEPDGIITSAQISRLVTIVKPYFDRWGIENVAHPVRGQPIWAPRGLLPVQKMSEFGIALSDVSNRLSLHYDYVAGDLADLYNSLLRRSANRISIEYKVIRKDFFVIVDTNRGGVRSYTRFHRDGSGSLGFRLLWKSDDGYSRGEQLATLISSSFYSRMLYSVSIPIPSFRSMPESNAVASTSPKPAPAPEPQGSAARQSSGSGFFVSDSGHIFTNAHVVEKCSLIEATAEGSPSRVVRLVASDPANDMALLVAEIKPPAILSLRSEAMKLGESVAAFGFPLSSLLSRNGNFTLGNVTALAGIGDDSRYLQVSTPVQAGNSGGPLLDYNGTVAGVVTAKLNAVRTAAITGDLPQNVNFAIKSSQAINFLDANRVKYSTAPSETKTPVELAELARMASVFISCR